MKTLSRLLLAALLVVASSVSAQSGSKIVFDAVANGQTGAMQTGAKAASVTLTFCGTGFSGNVYVDAAATQAGLAQVWTTALTGNSDCTTTYTKSPATKWYRVRWTRSAGTLNVWMLLGAPSYGSGSYADLTAPTGCATTELAYFLGSPATLTCLDRVYWTDSTRSLDVTDGRLQAANINAIGLDTPGSITVTPTLTQVATITTVAGSALADGDYFTIKYAVGNTVPIEFDATPGDGTTGGRVPLVFAPGDTADQIRDAIIAILNAAAPASLTASSGGAATVSIVLDTPGAVGDTNTENVGDAAFAVAGFVDPTHATTYGYKVEACLADGSCAPSAEVQTTTGHATLSNANYNSVTWGAVTGAATYKLTRVTGTPSGGDAPPRLLYSGPLLTFNDTNATSTSEAVATVNETGRVTTDGFTMATGAGAGKALLSDAAGNASWGAAGITNAAGANVLPKSDGTNLVASALSENGDTFSLGAQAGTNVAGTSKTFVGNLGTGNATSGTLVFQTGVPQASGTTQHVPATALTLTNSGTGGTSAPQALFASGTVGKPSIGMAAYPTAGIWAVDANTWRLGNAATAIEFALSGTTPYVYMSAAQSQLLLGPGPARLRGEAGPTLVLGYLSDATPVAQTFGVQGGSGTNIAGQPRVYRGSLGTGSADPGALIDRTGYPGSTGTTVHTESSRRYVSGHWTALTAGAATGFATLTYAASTSIGAEFFVTVRAGDGTNRQGMSYRVAINSVRDAAGNTQSVAAVIGTPPVAAGSGTLTCTFDAAEGASAATLRANCDSSLTETFLDANFQVIANGPGLTVGTL